MLHASLLIGPRARGTIGDTFTAANVKGKGVIKLKPVPTDRNTTAQSTQRTNFKGLVTKWHSGDIDSGDKGAFNNAASKRATGLSGWNYFMRYYRKAFTSGLIVTFITETTATIGAPNLTVAGKCSANIDLLINIYNTAGVFVMSSSATATAGVFSKAILLTLTGAHGFAEVLTANVLNEGRSGWYSF